MGYRVMKRLEAIVLAVLLAACAGDGDDDIDAIAIEVSSDLQITWDGGPIGDVSVHDCAGQEVSAGCPTAAGCSGELMWFIQGRGIQNPFVSPLEYGVSIDGGAEGEELVPGRTYSITAVRLGPCDADIDGPGCSQSVAQGCIVFTR